MYLAFTHIHVHINISHTLIYEPHQSAKVGAIYHVLQMKKLTQM